MDELEKAKEALLNSLRHHGIGKFGGTTVRDAIEQLIDAKITAADKKTAKEIAQAAIAAYRAHTE